MPDEQFVHETQVMPERVNVRRSQKVDKLVTALVAAQQEFESVNRDAVNAFYSQGGKVSKYATLDSAVSATRPYLNKHGLTVIQHLQSDNNTKELIVTTSLYHTSEQFFESDLALPSAQGNKFDPQTLASASTYGRRVAWLAITGCAPADDDDANKASGVDSGPPPSPKKVTAPPKPVLDANSKARNDDNSSKPLPPRAEIPPATAAPSAKPDRDQFQAYVTRVKDVIKVNLEDAGLKPSEDGKVTTGAKLQKYILSRSPGAKALTDLSIADWETFFGQVESETTYKDVIAKIEDHYKMEALKKL
jgi:hypothetical protein